MAWENKEEPKKVVKEEEFNFNFHEASDQDKVVITIYGLKGDGKTSLALNENFFPGSISCLSFDNKTVQIKNHFYKKSDRIKVYNAIEHFVDTPEEILSSAEKTYKYCLFLLNNIAKEKPDWILIDGLEIFSQIGEMVMRYRHGLKPFQGVANLNLWKVRRLVLRSLHKVAIESSKKGVIYTTYTDDDKVVEDGTLKTIEKIPKWTDLIMQVTDIVLYVYGKSTKEGRNFYFEVVSSKINDVFRTGENLEITRK